jgi:stress-induced morphogen
LREPCARVYPIIEFVMTTPEAIRERIAAALPGAVVQVADTTGAGDHFEVAVRAAAFAGKTLVEQHQLVYGALGGLMAEIHALSVQTAALQER